MNDFERAQKVVLVNRLRENPHHLVLVTGPRQTGKTTLVRQAIQEISGEKDCLYFSVDEPRNASVSLDPSLITAQTDENSVVVPIDEEISTSWLTRQWKASEKRAIANPFGSVLIVDEVQKISDWTNTVKGLWDANRRIDLPLHIVLLGSAPLLMQQGLSESMAGRFETISLTHWSFSEMSSAFGLDIDQYVYYGGYPGAAKFIEDQERWRSYIVESLIEPNIERDILALQRVIKPALLRRLFDYAGVYSGQIVSYSKILEHIQDKGNTATIVRYLYLLSNAGLVTGLSNFSKSSSLGRTSRPKLIVRNTALMTARSGYSFEEAKANSRYWGRLVETAVGAHLLNTAGQNERIFYWRDKNLEVDFVIVRAGRIRAIEVKTGHGDIDRRGLDEFQSRYGGLDPIVVGGNGMPLEQFLSKTAQEWLEG